MFERPKSGERAVLVQFSTHDETQDLVELRELALSAGAIPMAVVSSKRPRPDPRFLIGRGKLDELAQTIHEQEAELVLFNHTLTPSQEANLEKHLGVRVVDRTGLILDIFAQRAQTFEGKLQVELAQLRHLSTRLVRGWTHLERQKGGIGLRGPGETQLETDKRLIGNRIAQIGKRLEKVEQQRNQGRIARKRANYPVVALVGYTNAGKSTLFNALTGAGAYTADQLFATLDPILRRLTLSPAFSVILADTVGFIRHLPHELVAAFRSTLREAVEADLLLHVIDVTDARMEETAFEVERVLDEIGAEKVPRLRVFNKIDRQEEFTCRREGAERDGQERIWLSAVTGGGLSLLKEAIADHFYGVTVRKSLHLAPSDAGMRAKLFGLARILRDEPDGEGGWNMEVEIPRKQARLLCGYEIESSSNENKDLREQEEESMC